MEEVEIEINKEELEKLNITQLIILKNDYKIEYSEAIKMGLTDVKSAQAARSITNILTGIINERKRNLFIF